MLSFWKKLFFVVVGMPAIIAGVSFFVLQKAFLQPGPLQEDIALQISPGMGLAKIAGLLVENKVISSAHNFKIQAYLRNKQNRLRAGEFKFKKGGSGDDALETLVSGEMIHHHITIPEGLRVADIRKIIEGNSLLKQADFDLQEGSVLPETYAFSRGQDSASLVKWMKNEMKDKLTVVWEGRDKSLPYVNKSELLAMASIIEKEAVLASERTRIAAVFVNRLKIRMPLQADPTVLYAIARVMPRNDNRLTSRDLKFPSSYNTYLHSGLPPGPICCPGAKSIEAAGHPMDVKDLYFVADGSGGHAFSKTLREHQKNHIKWRKIRRKLREEYQAEQLKKKK